MKKLWLSVIVTPEPAKIVLCHLRAAGRSSPGGLLQWFHVKLEWGLGQARSWPGGRRHCFLLFAVWAGTGPRTILDSALVSYGIVRAGARGPMRV